MMIKSLFKNKIMTNKVTKKNEFIFCLRFFGALAISKERKMLYL